MIGNSMTMNIIERTREITTLRAIGLKPLHVTRLFLLEGIFIGIIGALGSLAIGYAIAAVINLYGIAMPPSPGQSQGYTAFIKTDSAALNWITWYCRSWPRRELQYCPRCVLHVSIFRMHLNSRKETI